MDFLLKLLVNGWHILLVIALTISIVFYNFYSLLRKIKTFRIIIHGQRYLDMEDTILEVLATQTSCTFNQLVVKRQDFIDDQDLFKQVLFNLVKDKQVNQTFPDYKLDETTREIPKYSLNDGGK